MGRRGERELGGGGGRMRGEEGMYGWGRERVIGGGGGRGGRACRGCLSGRQVTAESTHPIRAEPFTL